MSTYERFGDLSVHIDDYTLEGLSRRVSTGFRRFTTVFRLGGNGHEGVGEDVTYEVAEHRRLQRAGPLLPLAGSWTLDTFSHHLDRLDTFPGRPPASEVSRAYRRWALESAALDLALRQAGRPLHEVLERSPAPMRFVVSLNLAPYPRATRYRAGWQPAQRCASSSTPHRNGQTICSNGSPPAGQLRRSTSRASTKAR